MKIDRLPFVIYTLFFILHSLIVGPFCFAQEERLFEIKAKKFSYDPNVIRVKESDIVRIRLISEDVTHGFYLDGYKLDTSAHPGQDGHISFVADKKGRFVYRCSVTCGEFHPYMVGFLIVEPNSRFMNLVFFIVLLGLINASIIFFKIRK